MLDPSIIHSQKEGRKQTLEDTLTNCNQLLSVLFIILSETLSSDSLDVILAGHGAFYLNFWTSKPLELLIWLIIWDALSNLYALS